MCTPSYVRLAARTLRRACAFVVMWAVVVAVVGCGVHGDLSVRSTQHDGVLVPTFTSFAYSTRSAESADIYLTDLSLTDLDPGTPLDDLSGHLVHIHVFLVPRAGKTPIDANASNVTIRHVVFVRGAIGVYGGGGFLLTSGTPGDATFGGSMRDATLKVIEASPTFYDALGAAQMRGTIRAPLDEAAARRMADRLEDVIGTLRAGAR